MTLMISQDKNPTPILIKKQSVNSLFGDNDFKEEDFEQSIYSKDDATKVPKM